MFQTIAYAQCSRFLRAAEAVERIGHGGGGILGPGVGCTGVGLVGGEGGLGKREGLSRMPRIEKQAATVPPVVSMAEYDESTVQVRVVLLRLLAVVRKLMILDFASTGAMHIIAFAVVSLGALSWLVRHAGRGARAPPEP